MALGVCVLVIWLTFSILKKVKYRKLETEVFNELGISSWEIVPYFDANVRVKSRQALDKYDDVKFFKENKEKLNEAVTIISRKNDISNRLKNFLSNNNYKKRMMYKKIEKEINVLLNNAKAYQICVDYYSSAGNHLGRREIYVTQDRINMLINDPSILMGKGEYNKYVKEQQKEALNIKHHEFYDKVNAVIDYANQNKEKLVIKGTQEKIDDLIGQLFDRTVNSIKKIKSLESEEWEIIGDFIVHIESEIEKIVNKNQKILDYYESEDFQKIKDTCEVLMSSQREFNEYINEKVQSISKLFGTRVVRNETVTDDEYDYIRPYKKTISPFTAEVSATVFASAENNPLAYIVKNF